MAQPFSQQTTLHDARTGFYDIKPVALETQSIWLWVLAAAAAALLAALYRRFQRREPVATPAPLTTLEQFSRALSQLAGTPLADSQRASSLSLLLRSFVGGELQFAGADLTRREILQTLARSLPRALPRLAESAKSTWLRQLDELLRSLERAAFAERGQLAGRGPDWEALNAAALGLANTLFEALERERQRRESIVARTESKPEAGHVV